MDKQARTSPPTLPPFPCRCDEDPIEGIKQLFVDYSQGRAIASGRDPATRPVFLRFHGAAFGRLEVAPDLPEELCVGVFSEVKSYAAWIRFSSDVQPGREVRQGTVGVGIKIFDVPGAKLLPADASATTHDFIFQNHDVFFVDTAKDMCEFTCASLHQRGEEYLKAHPDTARVLEEMKKEVKSVLASDYWSVLPYQWGKRAVKYKLEPLEEPCPRSSADFSDPAYLQADLRTRLRAGEVRFRFLVQLQTNDVEMPLDAATSRWSEELSPPVHVATLVLSQQDCDARGQAEYGENLAMNPWHCLAEHAPLGSVAQARKVAYEASANNRRNTNGQTLGEPSAPRPATYAEDTPYPAAKDTYIVRARIHPAIGIARVGDSRTDYFIAPELVDPPPQALGYYRDATGALKREAARFRVYGYNASGEVVRELTSDWANVEWTVHVANQKAAFYEWALAMDIPDAKDVILHLRNAKITQGRETLSVDPGPRRVKGKSADPVECVGNFRGTEVKLGELRTDVSGRLLFLGGHGVSASPSGAPIFEKDKTNSFINAEDWYDDTSDGPVSAQVSIDGREIPVESAWVVTAPPNYAPQIKGQRTMYDLMLDLFIRAGWLPRPGKLSFRADIYPLLKRLSDMQWVNQGFATQFGHGGRYDFNDPDFVRSLAQLPATEEDYDPHRDLRRQIFNSFRTPKPMDGNQLPWPWLYGDGMESVAVNNPLQNAAITETQHSILGRWVEGDFADDWQSPIESQPKTFAEVPLEDQPGTLDRAALDFCLADAFHPGCEMTWPMRHLTMYRAPFRIRQRAEGELPPPLAAKIDQAGILAPQGLLYDQDPGGLTRWMGLPWQADTAYCRSGYDHKYDPYAPSFWPARVPNQVLSEEEFRLVQNGQLPMEQRVEAFTQRTNWNEPLSGTTAQQMDQMVHVFGSMGLVEERRWESDSEHFPSVMMVASFGPAVTSREPQVETSFLQGEPGFVESRPRKRGSPANFASPEDAAAAPGPSPRRKS